MYIYIVFIYFIYLFMYIFLGIHGLDNECYLFHVSVMLVVLRLCYKDDTKGPLNSYLYWILDFK